MGEQMIPVELLSANIIDARFENIDKTTVADVKNRIIDVIGCAIGEVNAPGNSAIIELIKDWGGKQESSVWFHNIRVPAYNASMVNTIMTRSFDFEVMAGIVEDTVFAGHHAASVVPTAFAVAELTGASGKEFLTAIILGDDIAARILVASQTSPIGIGWDGTMTLSNFGVTAAAG